MKICRKKKTIRRYEIMIYINHYFINFVYNLICKNKYRERDCCSLYFKNIYLYIINNYYNIHKIIF